MRLFFLIILAILAFPSTYEVYALEQLSDKEMKSTTGQRALTDFSIDGNTTRMFINTHIETWTEIESLKLGYYERTPGITGWDQDWTNLSFGKDTEDLIIDGFIMKADFVDINAAEPELKRLIIGTNRINGTVSGTFNSFTGAYNPALTSETTDDSTAGTTYVREDLGVKTFNFNSDTSSGNQGFFLILNPEAPKSGIHSIIGYSEGNINNNFSLNEWWDSP